MFRLWGIEVIGMHKVTLMRLWVLFRVLEFRALGCGFCGSRLWDSGLGFQCFLVGFRFLVFWDTLTSLNHN